LILAGAGTGKTLVLLKALEKLFQLGSQQLSLNLPAASYVLITYSNTLVKYDRYVASIIDIAERDERILSADQYLDLKFRQAFPDVFIEVDAVRALLGKAMKASAIDVLTPDDAYAEIEEFMFANDVTEAEYCIQGIDRSGMRRRLDPKERLLVWRLRCLVVELMESEKVFSRNYSRTRLAESARKNTELRTEDLVFVDEVQDLAPCDLLALKALSRKAIIMSGDNDQAIFRKGFSFKRAGIDIVGRSRTINLNFRNTLPINELAERFRERALTVIDAESGATRKAHERPSQAFRPGPPPELHVGNSESELGHLLIDKIRIYIDLLAYEPETITILGPDEPALSRVVQILDEAGIPNCLMDASSFSFSSSKGVRISGMKSAKGIDFSVTVLYLPRLPESLAAYDPGYNEAVIRNTIYVSLTRSMEQLAVIMPQDRPSKPKQPVW